MTWVYAVLPQLLEITTAEQIDAVMISHGHPDHCADLNPLLRARALGGSAPPSLPVFAPPGALNAVLALDRPGMLDDAYDLREFDIGESLSIGPFSLETVALPHWVPNAAVRVTNGNKSLTYTGDGGPSPSLVELAQNTDLLIAEASYADQVPAATVPNLTSACEAGQQARAAAVTRLMLTHLLSGTAPSTALEAARTYPGEITVAKKHTTISL